MNIGLVEPAGIQVLPLLQHLPGVVAAEPFRGAATRLRFGPRHRQVGLQGIAADSHHSRVIEAGYREIALPTEGLVVSRKLAEVRARVGDPLLVEFLEGRRCTVAVPITALADDFTGIAAYMERRALNRLLGEGDVITGASFTIDAAHSREFLRELKEIPRVGWVAIGVPSARTSAARPPPASVSSRRST